LATKYFILVLLFCCITLLPGLAQTLHTTSNKALQAYNTGNQSYKFLDLRNAEKYLLEAIKIDKNFYEAYMVLGEMFSKQRRFAESAEFYGKAVRIDSLFFKPVFFPLANAEMMSGKYADALIHYNVYLVQPGISEKNRAEALKRIEDCKFAVEAIKNPVPFNPVNLGDSVNTADDEYWPSITADGQTLMFTRQQVTGRSAPKTQEDFYTSHLNNDTWSKAVNSGYPLNTAQNEGAQTISSDGRYMYFTACERTDSYGRCDIYYSEFEGNSWSVPRNIGPPVNTRAWESQPSISANGRMLFFSSNRPGGIGGYDIWYSLLKSVGKWSEPVNLGKMINSPDDEMSPFIHFDGRTLYFSSNGKVGMGGFDIYFSKMKEDTTWTEPQNLGYPLNTYNDEMGLIIDAIGQKAYYSSKRDDIRGKDIYSFSVYESARPDPVSYFKGRVYDKGTGKLLKAGYELVNLKTGNIVVSNLTDITGTFLICLPPGYNYGLNVNKEGYLFYSDNFMLEGIHTVSEPLIKRIELSRVGVGEKLMLSNVFYEFDSWKIKNESYSELDKLARLLSDNKYITVEIGGYTDDIGTEAYNLDLSEKRAKSVMDYLIGKGIKANRLAYKGYGAASPIGSNITNDGRKLNRRTEIKVIGSSEK
jgi:flagellar motor protein MotB